MTRVGVVGHRGYPGLPDVLRALHDLAPSLGVELLVEDDLHEIDARGAPLGSPTELEALLTLGGDGTFLRGARLLAGHPAPILGVNFGRLGFLASYQANEVEDALRSLAAGDFTPEPRMALRAWVVDADGVERGCWTALNDVVLHKGGYARMLQLAVWADGERVASYAADGVVVSTPTGSTAYSLSLGGPVVAPTVESILLTAISPHTLAVRPLLLPPAAQVTIRVNQLPDDEVLLTVDGQAGTRIAVGDAVVVARSPHPVLVARLRGSTFFARLRHKLGWGGIAERDFQTHAS